MLKKEPLDQAALEAAFGTAQTAIQVIALQMELSRMPIQRIVSDIWALGYCSGFLHASLKVHGIRSASNRWALVAMSFEALLKDDGLATRAVRLAELSRERPEFIAGRTQGEQEQHQFINGAGNPTAPAMGLRHRLSELIPRKPVSARSNSSVHGGKSQ
jgi:hypothetical protein